MDKELKKEYESKKESLKSKLSEFKNKNVKEQYEEFLFCLLTPQSKAQKCWQAVEQLRNLKDFSQDKVEEILRTKTRFYKTKAKRIMLAKNTWQELSKLLSPQDSAELRNIIYEKVNGYGLKEASHFLRNIGLSDNKIAILDRHIIKNLNNYKVITQNKIKSKNDYLKIEKEYLKFAEEQKIPADELDLLW